MCITICYSFKQRTKSAILKSCISILSDNLDTLHCRILLCRNVSSAPSPSYSNFHIKWWSSHSAKNIKFPQRNDFTITPFKRVSVSTFFFLMWIIQLFYFPLLTQQKYAKHPRVPPTRIIALITKRQFLPTIITKLERVQRGSFNWNDLHVSPF